MNEQTTMPASFIGVLQRYVEKRDIKAHEFSQKLSLLVTQGKVAQKEYDDLLHQLQRLDPVPAFGVKIGQLIKAEDFGLVGYLLTACSTLGQALTRYGRFLTLVLSELSAQVEIDDDVVSLRWNLSHVNTQISDEFALSIFITLFQNLTGKTTLPIEVGLPFSKPNDADLYKYLFSCPVVFNDSSIRVDIPKKIIWQTISSGDPYLRQIFSRQAEAMLEIEGETLSDSFEEFFESLQEKILMAMKDGDTKASTLAQTMGVSLRGFYRILEAEGYSYRNILSGLRKRLAMKYLLDPNLTCSDVAMLLGYSEQSAFTRAFKDWMGVPPGVYRKQEGL